MNAFRSLAHRAIAALAADPKVGRRSGGVYSSWDLAEAYGFTDIDGRQPNWGKHFAAYLAPQPPESPPLVTRPINV